MIQNKNSIMLSTLGGQPQVITFALDALLEQGENISEVIILYLSDEGGRITQAMEKVAAEFVDDCYAGRPCRLRPISLRSENVRLPDIRDEEQANAAWEMLRDLVIQLKREYYHLHVCVSGGRRMMALLLLSVAMLQFDYRDKLWHMYTPREFQVQARDGAIMHTGPEVGFRLIQIPLIPLGMLVPNLRALTQSPPTTTPEGQPVWQDERDRERCEHVISQPELTPHKLEILKLFAAGMTPQEVAEKMCISRNTVESHKRIIFDLCRNAWEQENIRYYHLREWFGPYFDL